MPSHKLPGDEYPDPLSLLRDPNWEHNWPTLILRGIYDVMEKERRVSRGSLMERYIKAFNVVIYRLHKESQPPRIIVNNGIIELTPYGHKRNNMAMGLADFDESARAYYKKKKGKKTGKPLEKKDMRLDTKEKLIQLKRWFAELVRELPDAQPASSPVNNASLPGA